MNHEMTNEASIAISVTELAEMIRNKQFIEMFSMIQEACNKMAHSKGWYESQLEYLRKGMDFGIEGKMQEDDFKDEIELAQDGTRIALMHSELSEALEGLRRGNGHSYHIPDFSAVEEEFADVIIRIMDVSQERGWKVAEALIAKMEFNATRPQRHGGKKF